MDRHGLHQFPLPIIRKLRAVIEKGSLVHPSPKLPVGVREGSEYQTGPFIPLMQGAHVQNAEK